MDTQMAQNGKNQKSETKNDQDAQMDSMANGTDLKSTGSKAHTLSFNDIESLEQLRGELNLQAHLLRAELRERFDKLEMDWNVLDLQLAPIKEATTKATDDVSAAIRLLFDTVRAGYQDIKNATISQH